MVRYTGVMNAMFMTLSRCLRIPLKIKDIFYFAETIKTGSLFA
jgi:hypothetical protein